MPDETKSIRKGIIKEQEGIPEVELTPMLPANPPLEEIRKAVGQTKGIQPNREEAEFFYMLGVVDALTTKHADKYGLKVKDVQTDIMINLLRHMKE